LSLRSLPLLLSHIHSYSPFDIKFLAATLASLGLASAASVAKKVSYDDWKVYRVNVGSNAAKITM
jgi:hypothetical protein